VKAPESFGQAFIELCKRSDELSGPASEADASRFDTSFTEIRSQTFAGRTIRDRVLDERLPTGNVVESQQSASYAQAAFEHSCDIVGYKRRFLMTKNGYIQCNPIRRQNLHHPRVRNARRPTSARRLLRISSGSIPSRNHV
jgi:hypothetical protein